MHRKAKEKWKLVLQLCDQRQVHLGEAVRLESISLLIMKIKILKIIAGLSFEPKFIRISFRNVRNF